MEARDLLADSRHERSEALCRTRLDPHVESAINVNQSFPEERERRATAPAAALAGAHHWFEETAVQTVQQLPRTAITHVEVARRLRQRPAALDLLEQCDLARSHAALAIEIDPEANAWVSYFRRGAQTSTNLIDVWVCRALQGSGRY